MRTYYTPILILLVFGGVVFSQDRPNVIFVMPDDIEWKEGKLVQCKIKSLLGKPCIVRCGEKTVEYSNPAGKTIEISGTIFYQ